MKVFSCKFFVKQYFIEAEINFAEISNLFKWSDILKLLVEREEPGFFDWVQFFLTFSYDYHFNLLFLCFLSKR